MKVNNACSALHAAFIGILSLMVALVLIACSERADAKIPLVKFGGIWTSPYRPSADYAGQLVNESGEYLFILNKTAWAYFACENPQNVLDKAKKHGANVIRVCLEGAPYEDYLKYDLWPWGGSRKEPDFTTFNEPYWDEVEKRIALAGENDIGLDLVLYFDLVPEVKDVELQKKYWSRVLDRLSRYSNILTWEIMNEEISNNVFQDSAGMFFKQNDPNRHPVISSDGTTDDALWPHKEWMDMAIVHTCTGDQPGYDLQDWYLNIARNTVQYGKPAFNNESGREKRHKNDDPVHRRKQGWLFATTGCFWTWHSWDGCEGINDTSYYADGWQYLVPMKDFFSGIPFWKLTNNHTVVTTEEGSSLVHAASATAERDLVTFYCCTRETGETVRDAKALLRIRDGDYKAKFINPSTGEIIDQRILSSRGLKQQQELVMPSFTDDLLIEISVTAEKEKSLIEGTL